MEEDLKIDSVGDQTGKKEAAEGGAMKDTEKVLYVIRIYEFETINYWFILGIVFLSLSFCSYLSGSG